MGEDRVNEDTRNAYLFQHLIAMFQTLAWQQLGKLVNPVTGEADRDLQQARITIDMLQMIREKTTGNLTETEKAILDGVLMELQMNYVDELERREKEPEEAPEAEESKEAAGDSVEVGEKPEEGGVEKGEEHPEEGAEESKTEGAQKKPRKKRSKTGKKPKAKSSKSKAVKNKKDEEKE